MRKCVILQRINIYVNMDYNIKDFEIMAPVGSRESLAAAIQAGADSIYFGIEKLNMRAHSASTLTTCGRLPPLAMNTA